MVLPIFLYIQGRLPAYVTMELECDALGSSVLEFTYIPKVYKYDIETFLYREGRMKVVRTLRRLMNDGYPHVKIQLSLQIQITKLQDERFISIKPWFNSETLTLYSVHSLKLTLLPAMKTVLNNWDSFIHLGSGWMVDHISKLRMSVCKYHPLSGGGKHCPSLPKTLLEKKATTSIVCPNDDCFIYCILAALFPQKRNPNRYTKYKKYVKKLVTSNLTYPVSIKQIPRFEKDNNLSINCYGFEKIIHPLYISKHKSKKEVDLLLYKNHYYLIRNLSRLICSLNSKNYGRRFICRSCLSVHYSEEKLQNHLNFCDNDGQRYTLPPPNTYKSFENFRGQIMNDFVIFFDMESALVNNSTEEASSSSSSKLKKIARHQPIAVGAKRVCIIPEFDGELRLFTGEDCIEQFLEYLSNEHAMIQTLRWVEYKDIDWTPESLRDFHSKKHCDFCGRQFSQEVRKTADHNHIKKVDNYRGALCNRCNLTYASSQRYIPIIGHAALSYDVKNLLTTFAKKTKQKHVFKVLAKNREKFHCMYLDQFMFIDSYSFLQASLRVLTDSLKQKGEDYFVHTRKYTRTEQQFQLLLQKGIMCYSYIDGNYERKLKEPRLPRKEYFYDSLQNESLTDLDYSHACKVFEEFGCKNLGDYLLVYLAADVLQLADVFTAFRKRFYKDFGLDATHYISLPQLAFDALLKESQIRLELISDIDMYNWITASIRGGFSGILHREAVANNKYLNTYDENIPDSYIMLFDVCNLYGYTMSSKPMPVDGFRWLSAREIDELDVMSLDSKSSQGYMLEVDLEYPDSLHELHKIFPLAPEKRTVSSTEWSPWTKDLALRYKLPIKDGAPKLLLTLENKHNYILHYILLKFYLSQGLILKKVHKVLTFRQKAWMRDFVLKNAIMRKQAVSTFDQNMYKLSVNSLYGKTLQSNKNKIDFRLITEKKKFLKLSSKPTFKSAQIINSGLVGVEMKQPQVELSHVLYTGSTILDLSKLHLYKFHYEYMLPTYGKDDLTACMSDTDSILYHIQRAKGAQCPYEDIEHNLHHFDTSNYPASDPAYSLVNKKRLGRMKEEGNGRLTPYTYFCGLQSKVYSLEQQKCKDTKKGKGIKKSTLKSFSAEDYENTLLNRTPVKTHKYQAIRSFHNQMFTVEGEKRGLSAFDDKFYILDDGISTLPYGHFRIKNGLV